MHYLTLIDTLARFHLQGEAQQFSLGYFWWFLEPLYISVFYVVFQLLLDRRQPDFLYFLTVGKLVFVWFSKSVVQASSSIETNKGLISQVLIRKRFSLWRRCCKVSIEARCVFDPVLAAFCVR